MTWIRAGLALSLLSCGALPSLPDAGPSGSDAGPADAGAEIDGGGPVDAGPSDAGLEPDAGPVDAGMTDAGLTDAGLLDAGPDAGAPDASTALDAGPGAMDSGTRLRLVAANLTTGTNQTYDPGEGQRILQGLQGDIVGIQEFNVGDNSAQALGAFVQSTFDGGAFWHRGSGRIPNGIISRYPIVDAGEWDDTRTTDREFTWAVIDVPGPAHLWVVSLHLLSNTPQNRQNQALQLQALLSANVGPGTFVALIGDLNTDTRSEPALGALDASVVVTAPWPSDLTQPDGGNGNTSTNRSRPYDWVLVSSELHRLETPVRLGSQLFPTGLVFDSRVFTPLPPPVLVGDSAGLNMQHMAVVRDFALAP